MRYASRAQHLYFQSLLVLARNKDSFLYFNRQPRLSGDARIQAFWQGYNGDNPPDHDPPGAMLLVAYRAGEEFKRREAKYEGRYF